MSKIEVNTIGPQCGTTVTVGEGAGQTVAVDAATVNLGRSGGTVNLTCGATQSGFGRTGTVDWDTASIKTAEFTAVSGNGYFVNTTSGTVKVNLPAGSAGDIVGLKDYAGTWGSNAITLAPNGSDNIGGATATDPAVSNEGGSLLLVYVDGTQGWLTTQQSVTPSPSGAESFIIATGGTPCAGQTSGDYKYHTFTGPGTFCVSQVAGCAGQNVVSYMVVAGGAGGGGDGGGGGGAGGFREYKNSCDPYTASPLNGNPGGTAITVSATGYPITVGAGGGVHSSPPWSSNPGGQGADSVFSTITSTGGGTSTAYAGSDGGSGGGGGRNAPRAAGSGNTPSVTPAQGTAGGAGSPGGNGAGGAGGATVAGTATCTSAGGAGGTGATSSINATPTARAGGGGGGATSPTSSAGGAAGAGGGGAGAGCGSGGGAAGTVNTGGGGGGGTGSLPPTASGAGGSGIVILRYKFQ